MSVTAGADEQPEVSQMLNLSETSEMLATTLSDLTQMRIGEAFEEQPLDDYDQLDIGEVVLFHNRAQEFLELQHTPAKILLRDKLGFVLGTMLALLSAFWLGWSPQTFYKFHASAAVVLFTLRWILYKMKKWHYYMLDFCYFANIILMANLLLFPRSAFLHKVTFAYGAGPLAWSIVAFRNSLVFHSLDKITSLFLHWFPACVAWAERWHSDAVRASSRQGDIPLDQWNAGTWRDLVLLPMAPYLVWAVFYYIKVFVISSEKIQERGYETLYRYVMKNPKSAVSRFILKFPRQGQPLAYMGLHVVLTGATFLLCRVWWSCYWAHTLLLVVVLTVSAWNGASYYFDYFAHRYVRALGIPLKPSKAKSAKSD